MIRIMVMNGLLISLILIWTSAAKEPSAGYLIKSSTKHPTGPLNYSVSKPMVSLHETNKEILRRKFLCGSELGGVCVNKKKSCPSNLPSEKSPGKPYCSKKKDRCCYPDPTTAAPPTVVPTTTTTSEDVNWSDIRNACIKSNNYKTYQPLTLDNCKEKCVEEDAINCQSIEYSSAQQMCAISEARSDSDDFIEPCFVDGWVFAEIELNAGPTTGAPTTLAPSNTTSNGQTTNPPTTTAPSNTTNNVSSCNLVWNYEEDHPLIMIRETKTIVPPIIDIEISEDPNRIPEGKKLIFACPGENNQFNHVQGTHTKLHGECISHEQFKVCVNNYPEILDLSQLSCSSKMQPSIIKQDNDTSYEKSCEDIGGELYKFGYIYGDYREFKDLDTKFCFREKDQTTLWTSTNIDRIEISPSMRSMDPANFRTARGLAMNTFYSQKSQQETLKEILDKEVKSVWNDKACRNHGGHCVRGGRPCPKHLPHHTSQGEPFCTSFYRCCYSDQCDPTTCTYKGKKGNCSLDSLPGTTGVGSQECKKGCQCYIKDNKTLRQFESLQERMGNGEPTPKPSVKKRCNEEESTADVCGLQSLLSQDIPSNPSFRAGPYIERACEYEELSITCDVGHTISVTNANFGRISNAICNDLGTIWPVNCLSGTSLKVVTDRCGGQKSCKVVASDTIFGNPCGSVYKYLEVQYDCEPGCDINLDELVAKLHGHPPLVIDVVTKRILYQTSVIHGRKMLFTCPGLRSISGDNGNKFKKNHPPCGGFSVICSYGELFFETTTPPQTKVTMKNMGCEKKVSSTSSFNWVSNDNGICDANDRPFAIGFITPVSDLTRPLIQGCFHFGTLTTRWTSHTIQGEYLNEKVPYINKPDFKLFGFDVDEDVNGYTRYFYHEKTHYLLFLQLLQRKDVICRGGNGDIKLVRGHMTPAADFATPAERDATYYLINTLPQWQSINGQGGNWAAIERRVRNMAKEGPIDLNIISGGIDVLALKQVDSPQNFFYIQLGNEYKYNTDDTLAEISYTGRIPVPALTWKIVLYHGKNGDPVKGIAFVVVNNPLLDIGYGSPPSCADHCHQIKWLYTDAVPFEKYIVHERGYTHCCEIKDFLSQYKNNIGLEFAKTDDFPDPEKIELFTEFVKPSAG